MRDKNNPYDLNDYSPMQLRSNPYDLSSPIRKPEQSRPLAAGYDGRLSQSRPKCTQKKAEPKTYFCPYKGASISGVAARNCNNLLSLETYECKYQETCVAKEGLEEFAQSLPKCTEEQNQAFWRAFQKAGKDLQAKLEKRKERDKILLESIKTRF